MISVTFEAATTSGLKNDLENFLQLLGGVIIDDDNGRDQDDDNDVPVNPYEWLDQYVGHYKKHEPEVKALWRIIPNYTTLYGKNRVTVKMPRWTKTGKMKVAEGSGNPLLVNPKEVKDKVFLYPGDKFWGWRRSFQADGWRGKEVCDPKYGAVPELFVELVGELRDGVFTKA